MRLLDLAKMTIKVEKKTRKKHLKQILECH